MRIAHVVTYISPDGAFGGPVRVALGQAEALAERGHEVTVYAGAPPELAGVKEQDGYTLKTFPARRVAPFGGFASMAAPRLTQALKREASSFDVAHIHLARDLVTIPAAQRFRKAGVRYVVQPHGMIDASDSALAMPLDAVATKPLLRDAATVLTLTDREVEDIAGIEPAARTARISNGIRIREIPQYEGRDDIVLFLARLHPRKRPLAFIEMARLLKDRLPTTRFVLAGPDEGEGEAARTAISAAQMGDRIEWIGAVAPDQTETLMSSVRAYVLPSLGEIFPMTILEALRVGTPVVTTDSLGIAADCRAHGAAIVTDGSASELARATERVLQDSSIAHYLRAGGLTYVRDRLDIELVAVQLERNYVGAASGVKYA